MHLAGWMKTVPENVFLGLAALVGGKQYQAAVRYITDPELPWICDYAIQNPKDSSRLIETPE